MLLCHIKRGFLIIVFAVLKGKDLKNEGGKSKSLINKRA